MKLLSENLLKNYLNELKRFRLVDIILTIFMQMKKVIWSYKDNVHTYASTPNLSHGNISVGLAPTMPDNKDTLS